MVSAWARRRKWICSDLRLDRRRQAAQTLFPVVGYDRRKLFLKICVLKKLPF